MSRDTILFDINETVLDLGTLRPKFEATFGDAGVTATWFAMLLHTSTVCALTGVKSGFAELARNMLDAVAARRGVALDDATRTDILGTFADLEPHDDVIPALQHLRATGYRTVAFSNSSLALVSAQITNAGLDPYFDEVVSVEETGSFKPDAAVYRFVSDKVGRELDALRLVAAHDWDTHGALCAGMRAAYVDRSGMPYHPAYRRPDVFAASMHNVVGQILNLDRA